MFTTSYASSFLAKEAGNFVSFRSLVRLSLLSFFALTLGMPALQAQITIVIDDLSFTHTENKASVYPNPVTGSTVTVEAGPYTNFTKFEVHDASGNPVFGTLVDGSATHELSLSPGTYYFRTRTQSGVWLVQTVLIE